MCSTLHELFEFTILKFIIFLLTSRTGQVSLILQKHPGIGLVNCRIENVHSLANCVSLEQILVLYNHMVL